MMRSERSESSKIFFFNDTATTEIYTLSLHDALPISPTACRQPVSGTVSLPSSGCFSPFPHGTSSLSVIHEYLGLEGGPPMFRQDYTCPALLESSKVVFAYGAITRYGATFQ